MTKKETEIENIVESLFYCDAKKGKLFNKIRRNNYVKQDAEVGYLTNYGYLVTRINRKIYQVHRLIWRLYYGKWPNFHIDHINRNKTDNRISNLRDVTNRQNHQNKKCHRMGHLVGTSYRERDNKFRSHIKVNYKQLFLGQFESKLEAHEQYLRALKAVERRKFKSAKELRDYLKKV